MVVLSACTLILGMQALEGGEVSGKTSPCWHENLSFEVVISCRHGLTPCPSSPSQPIALRGQTMWSIYLHPCSLSICWPSVGTNNDSWPTAMQFTPLEFKFPHREPRAIPTVYTMMMTSAMHHPPLRSNA